MSQNNEMEDLKLSKDLSLNSEFTPPSFAEWKKQVEKDLKGAPYEKKLVTKTYDGFNLNPIYTKEDLKDLTSIESYPGSDKLLRGNLSAGYHSKSWDVNQEIFEADAAEYNSAIIDALNNGQNCVNILLDSATRLGLDADYADPKYVGDIGLSISAINSIKRALNNIDLTNVPIYANTGYDSVPFLSLLNAHFQTNNIDISRLSGSITADPISHLAEYGELPVKLEFIFDMMKNSHTWAAENSPKLNTIGISTIPFINAGANTVQELAISLSVLVYYINQLAERGVNPNDAINRTQFTFGIGNNYFMEISKFRAIRILLSNVMSKYDVDSKDLEFNIGAKTSSYGHTILDPYVNMLRSTTQSFSAILGGVNFITTSPFDELYNMPNSFSRRIARNTQTILREESHLDQVIDPAGGSYYIESLTGELAKTSWNLFQLIEKEGGIVESLSNGTIQTWIDEVSKIRQKDVNKRKSVIVGTNMFADVKEKREIHPKLNQEEFKKKRSEYLEKFRLNGSKEKHESVMEKLNDITSQNTEKIIDLVTEAYLLGTTLGEITSALNSSQKQELKITQLKIRRASEGFEILREKAENYKKDNGELPKIYLLNYGSVNEYKARSEFSKGFFEVGGFEVIDPLGSKDLDELTKNALQSDAAAVVICSTDDNYTEIVPTIANELKRQNQDLQIILAGYPKEQIDEHKKSGIDDFIFLGADVMEKLTALHTKIGGSK